MRNNANMCNPIIKLLFFVMAGFCHLFFSVLCRIFILGGGGGGSCEVCSPSRVGGPGGGASSPRNYFYIARDVI